MGRDSSELLWDDINRPKFYALLTCASACIRTCLYPAALVKTRLQASGSGATPAAAAAAATAHTPAFAGAGAGGGGGSGGSRFMPHISSAVPKYNGTGHALSTILRTEGKFALYRGFRVNLLGLACDPVVIGTIEYTRTQLTYYSDHWSPLRPDGHYDHAIFRHVLSPSTAITLVSAGGSAMVGQIIQVPVDVVTQKKQMQMHTLQAANGDFHKPHGTSSLHIAREILDAEGLRGLYKGFGVTLCSAMPFTAILWAVYWPTQKLLAKGLAPRGAPSPHLLPTPHTGEHDKFSTTLPSPQPGVPATATSGPQPPPAHLDRRRMPPGAVLPPEELHYMQAEQQHELERQRRESPQPAAMGWFNFSWRDAVPAPIAAFLASSTASLATQPIDVIKTRLQVQGGKGATIASTIRALIKERGYVGLAAGWYPRILAVAPQATIMMTSYEALKRYSAK